MINAMFLYILIGCSGTVEESHTPPETKDKVVPTKKEDKKEEKKEEKKETARSDESEKKEEKKSSDSDKK